MRCLSALYCAAILLFSTYGAQVYATTPSESYLPDSSEHDQLCADVYEHTIGQTNTIIFLLQQWIQQITNDIIKVSDKAIVQHEIAKTLSYAEDLKRRAADCRDEHALQQIIEIQTDFINYLQDAVDSEFYEFIAFGSASALYHTLDKKTVQELKAMLNHNDSVLDILGQQTRILGKSILNLTARRAEYFLKKLYADKIILRSWPYVVLSHWWLVHVSPEAVEKLSDSLARYKQNIDSIVNAVSDRFMPTQQAPASKENMPSVNGLQAILGGLVEYKVDTLFTLGIGGLMLPYIQQDIKDLSSVLKRYGHKAYAKLHGLPVPPDLLRNPRGNFAKLIGQEAPKELLKPAIAYLCDSEKFLNAQQKPHRGYLFFGPRYSGKKSFADAVAGEVSEQLKSNPGLFATTVCKVCELRASELTPETLEKALEEAARATPCVVIINNLELLDTTEQSTLVKFIKTIIMYFRNKRDSIIIATTSDINAVHPALLEPNLFSGRIYLGYPNYEDRAKCMVKKLTDNGLNPQHFALDAMARATEGCPFSVITTMLDQLFAYANATKQPVTSRLFEEMIDREVYHIGHHQVLTPEEARVLAAHFAGQALVHLVKQPGAQLVKVTILPVVHGSSKKYGQRFTYDPSKLSTLNVRDLQKECAIELAGDIAQELLFGTSDASIFLESKQRAAELALASVLQGVDEKLLSRDLRDKLRNEAYALLTTLAQEMRELLEAKKDALVRIAQALEEKQTLTVDEIQNLM